MYGELNRGGRRAWPFLPGVGAPVTITPELLALAASYRAQPDVIGREGQVRALGAQPAAAPITPPADAGGWPAYMRAVDWSRPSGGFGPPARQTAPQRPAQPRRAPLPAHPPARNRYPTR